MPNIRPSEYDLTNMGTGPWMGQPMRFCYTCQKQHAPWRLLAHNAGVVYKCPATQAETTHEVR